MVDKQGSTVTLTAGVYRASSYSKWSCKVASGPVVAASPASLNLVNGVIALPDGRVVNPFAAGATVNVGTGANQETVTIVSVSNCYNGAPFGPASGSPTISVNTSNTHGQGDEVTSSSGGLFEACLDASNAGGGTVVVDASCSATAAQILAAAALYPLVDILNYTAGSAQGISEQATLSTATQPTYRLIDSELVIASTVTSISGSAVGVRGNITQNASGTLGSGSFQYGVQGKLTLKGTLDTGSGFNAGLFGQVDTSAAGFAHTSGYLAPIMGDFGATAKLASDANANMVSLLNTTNCIINSAVQFIGNATYAMDFSDLAYGGAHFITSGASGGSNSANLVIRANGVAYKIQLYA